MRQVRIVRAFRRRASVFSQQVHILFIKAQAIGQRVVKLIGFAGELFGVGFFAADAGNDQRELVRVNGGTRFLVACTRRLRCGLRGACMRERPGWREPTPNAS